MELLDIPEEVFYGTIFPLLDYKDLLRLRLVNHTFLNYADGYRNQRLVDHEIEINEQSETMQIFLENGISSSLIYLNIKNPSYYINNFEAIQTFLRKLRDKLTHLRVRKFFAFTAEGEFAFFEGLKQLKHLSFQEVDVTEKMCNVCGDSSCITHNPPPENFKNLLSLQMGRLVGPRDVLISYNWNLFKFCVKLLYFKTSSYPYHLFSRLPEQNMDDVNCFQNLIRERSRKCLTDPNLKYYDIGNIQPTPTYIFQMIHLLRICNLYGVKLLNVNSALLAHLQPSNQELGRMIASVNNINNGVFSCEMLNLEKLSIEDMQPQSVDYELIQNPLWPNLQNVQVLILPFTSSHGQYTLFFQYLFGRGRREKLTELCLNFVKFYEQDPLPFPLVRSIVNTCPHLIKLTLTSYPHHSPNRAYSTMWKHLKLLEEISLDYCNTLGNAGFVGPDINDPTFLHLKHLRKLTLNRLHLMPKITDTFFQIVLRNTLLTHFYICDSMDLTNVTENGIRSLLTGDFAKTIQCFPFRGWSIKYISETSFLELGQQFRSSHL